ncbi:P-loop ATPase, Sll1717 family [Pseudoalteromonas sp. ZZD1]|uniref:P-loop ATPase, Sll1717 family n=1 Tax=Pseudoalteromonas sp. ZZD1 TaxID=3139395 RepID=UPI003BAB3AB6
MSSKKSKISLPDPFPVNYLRALNFGSADGHRDNVALEAFIVTSSVRQFFLNQHSIVVGAIGTGKSTLFRLLKSHSQDIEAYKEDLIVSLEEALSFNELNSFVKEYYQGKEEKTLYQLLWKFNALSKIAISISQMDGFPANDYEKDINKFLTDSNSADSYTDIITKVKALVSNATIKLEANIADNPISFEAGLGDKNNAEQKKINLEEVQRAISKAIKERGFRKVTVIIDKIDKFVAGVEYRTQREFISALLDVDDDLASDEHINLKVFLRADLFERLDFSSLGYDKVTDNVVFLKWSKDETLRFLATRILTALKNSKIAHPEQLLQATDLTEFDLSKREKLLLNPKVPKFVKAWFSKKEKVERNTSLYEKCDKAIITKLFPRDSLHYCVEKQDHIEISTFDFLSGHFLDGNNVCTPRYMLIFLKEVVNKVASYYEENPDQVSELVLVNKDWEWDLFKKNCVYEAYVSAKNTYVKNVGTLESKWTKNFEVFLAKKGNKTKFDYKWLRGNIPDISEKDAVDFISFLQVIGFLKISEAHPDVKKRGYELPILYKVSPMPNKAIKNGQLTVG